MKKRIAEGTTIELAKPGVNLTLLWTEYCSDCYASKLTPYMYTQFCDKYRKWARLTKATMRITHKPGDAMQVDWAGTTIPYYDRVTGEATDFYLYEDPAIRSFAMSDFDMDSSELITAD